MASSLPSPRSIIYIGVKATDLKMMPSLIKTHIWIPHPSWRRIQTGDHALQGLTASGSYLRYLPGFTSYYPSSCSFNWSHIGLLRFLKHAKLICLWIFALAISSARHALPSDSARSFPCSVLSLFKCHILSKAYPDYLISKSHPFFITEPFSVTFLCLNHSFDICL